MPKVRNVSDSVRFIPCLNREVDVDEAFDVPQELFDSREWEIPETFEVVQTVKGKE